MAAQLCDKVIEITEDYLGPAADRFIKRQIAFHLNKKPEQLTTAELPKLAEWIKISLALLTEDKTMVDKCESQILKLSHTHH